MKKTASRLRTYLFRLCTLVLIVKIISEAWFTDQQSARVNSLNNASVEDSVLTPSLEERTLLWQLKIALGSLNYLREKSKDYTSSSFPLQSLEESIKHSFSESTFVELSSKNTSDDSALQLYVKKYAFARYLEIESAEKKYHDLVLAHSSKRPYLNLAQKLIDELENNNAQELTEAKLTALNNALSHFGLFGKLLLKDLNNKEQRANEIKVIASSFFRNFAIALSAGALFTLSSIICFIFYTYKIFSGKLKSSLIVQTEHADYALEIFCLYLASMLFLPNLILYFSKQGYLTNTLAANIFFILPLAALVFWPKLFGLEFSNIRSLLGLRLKNLSGLTKDLFAGPTAYLAYWVVLFSVLVVYSLVMLKLGINTEDSAHPVVPLLASTENKMNIVYIFILAVIIAPFVEEIMFRGAFYCWLRARFGVLFSVLLSSFIFASVHPQGAVGVLPLTFIGILLALLREWRGTLVAPMIAHACFNAGTLSLVLFIFRS